MRLVEPADITMRAGLFFLFHAVYCIDLPNAFHACMRTVAEKERSQRKPVFFCQNNREFGVAQACEDVV